MNIPAILKIIVRSWWRNKVFFFISIVSLAIGLACTNLLFTYFVHDYNIESSNRDKHRIFCLRQDNPIQDGNKVAYAGANIPPMLKEKYAEVEDYLRINSMAPQYCKYGEKIYHDIIFISADTTLQHFFHYHSIAGSLRQVLEQPGKVALSEAFAHKLFGDTNPLGELLKVKTMTDTQNYEVAAILKSRSQSLLQFDMITGNGKDFWGGVTLLKLTSNTDSQQFAEKSITTRFLPCFRKRHNITLTLCPTSTLLHRTAIHSNLCCISSKVTYSYCISALLPPYWYLS